MPTTYIVLSPLDVLLASLAAKSHDGVVITAVGAACHRCRRVLDVDEWAEPCAGMDPVGTQPISIPS